MSLRLLKELNLKLHLKEWVSYDPETGIFTNLIPRRGCSKGAILGCRHPTLGYIFIGIDNERYYGHRLAWLYMHGEWPEDQIDHANGDRADNRICNLRLASSSQNKCNRAALKKNRLGAKGVWQLPYGSFRVRVKFNGQIMHDKVYKTLHEAKLAYQAESKKYHGEFAKC